MAPGHDLTAAHPKSNWVRGHFPGRHIQGAAEQAQVRLQLAGSATRGTLQELTKLGPVSIIADALGFHPATIELHAVGSASTYTEYMAAMRDLKHP